MTERQNQTTIIGIDAGSSSSGIIVLTENGIREGYNMPNEEVFNFIQRERSKCIKMEIIIEDVRPYNMRITNGIIQTIKFLGQMEWRLQSLDAEITLIPRWNVKQWVFMQFKTIVLPEIEKKIDRWAAKEENKDRTRMTAKFIWVDDRMIANAMRKWWGIKNPTKVGQRAMYNLKDHSWQALALVSYHMVLNGLKMQGMGVSFSNDKN